MDRTHVKDAPDIAKGTVKDLIGKQPELKFAKPLGSSHDDKADLRDVVRMAAKKSE